MQTWMLEAFLGLVQNCKARGGFGSQIALNHSVRAVGFGGVEGKTRRGDLQKDKQGGKGEENDEGAEMEGGKGALGHPTHP